MLVTGFTIAGAEVYEAVTEDDGVAGLDRPVLDLAIRLRSARLDRALTGFTHLGGPTGMTIIASMITLADGLALALADAADLDDHGRRRHRC